jgi:hypothetical protein
VHHPLDYPIIKDVTVTVEAESTNVVKTDAVGEEANVQTNGLQGTAQPAMIKEVVKCDVYICVCLHVYTRHRATC